MENKKIYHVTFELEDRGERSECTVWTLAESEQEAIRKVETTYLGLQRIIFCYYEEYHKP